MKEGNLLLYYASPFYERNTVVQTENFCKGIKTSKISGSWKSLYVEKIGSKITKSKLQTEQAAGMICGVFLSELGPDYNCEIL